MNMRVEHGQGIGAPYELSVVPRILETWLPKIVASPATAAAADITDARLGPLGVIRQCQRVTPELATALWQGLLDGKWSLVAHSDHGQRRLLLARLNRPGTFFAQALSAREQRAVRLAIEGHSTKHVSYELNVAISTASTLVASAIRKLGLRSRVELTEVFRPPLGSPMGEVSAHTFDVDGDAYALIEVPLRRLEPPRCLTEAEREVVLGVLSAKSNAEIARARRTSVNTVANQLRAVYAKLGISGRSELISAC